MRLVRWLQRGYHNARMMEPGDEMLVEDSVILGPHMLDVASGERGPLGDAPAPDESTADHATIPVVVPTPIFFEPEPIPPSVASDPGKPPIEG